MAINTATINGESINGSGSGTLILPSTSGSPINGAAINSIAINGSSSANVIELSQISIQYGDVFSGTLLPTLKNIHIHHGGNSFSDGRLYDISPNNGKMLIKNCFNGSIVAMEYINFGYNYYDTFQQILYPSTTRNYATAVASVSGGKVTNIELVNPGSGYTGTVTVKIIGGGGAGATATCSVSSGSIAAINLIHQGNFYTHSPSIIFDDEVAVIEHQIGTVRKYPGYYTDSDSLVSDESFVQDGQYYQTYSYQIEVDELFSKYSGVVKNLLHPAGYNMYGALSKYDSKNITAIAKILALQTDQFPIDEVFIGDARFATMYKNVLDSLSTIDIIEKFMGVGVDESVSIDDMINVSRLLFLTDSTNTISDLFSISNFAKLLADSTNTITDSIYIPPFLSLVLTDNVTPHSYNPAEMYSTNFNSDYFASDYMETVENFSKTL